MPTPTERLPDADDNVVDESPGWPELRVKVPPAWKLWLQEAAEARALSVSALVRQCIRSLMIARHEQ